MSYVLQFDKIDPSTLTLVGGKAANLGALTQGGLPVPPGFCVTTDAYHLVVGDRLDDLFTHLASAEGPDAVAGLAAQARELIISAPVPADIERQLVAGYRALGRPPVAVRSSATAEDLEFASFAGQQDTYLNVVGDKALAEAVRRCWASLWTDRAVSYRNLNNIDQREVALAVVVQEMVQSFAAGVMFTANPVTGTRHETVIDASPGLGESVVSGAVNPDRFVVDRAKGTIVERRLGDKRVLIRSLAGGGTEHVEQEDSSGAPCITDPQVLALARLGQDVEDLYQAPQDTEWAIDDAGVLWLTQARPITTLYPLPEQNRSGDRIYMCMSLAQGLTRPITPMGLAAFRLIASSVATAAGSPPPQPFDGPRPFREAGQRMFVDVTGAIRNSIGRRAVLNAFGVMEARAAVVLKGLGEQPQFSIIKQSPLKTLRPIARVAVVKARAPQRAIQAMISPERSLVAIAAAERRLRAELDVPADAAPEQRLDHVERQLGTVFLLMPTIIGYPIGGFLLLALARKLLGPLAKPGELQTVLRGLPHNVTTEMDLALWDLTQQIRADEQSALVLGLGPVDEVVKAFVRGSLPPVAQRGLTDFLTRYGHRAVAEIDLGMPRWSDDPTHLVSVIINYLRLEDESRAPDVQFAAGNREAEEMVDTLVQRCREQNRIKAGIVGFGLSRARQLAGLREMPKNLLVLALASLRHQLALVGAELAKSGRVDAADDVFFLDLVEARRGLSGADLHALVVARKEAYEVELKRRRIPRILLSDGTEPEAVGIAVEHPDGALVGSPASAGRVTAPARVVLDPVGAHLEPGEILVAPSTDPGWTPLFLTAGGLVMEMGGSNSHGAVVAREYGIPAVVGVPDATSKITTGQTVTVDGAAGLVLPG
jgi:pyruvate,water dikinase